jgi:rhodanese-related sulfurtransferase
MKNVLLVVGLMAAFSACSQQNTPALLVPTAYAEMMHKESGILLDVRTAEEFAEAHLEGATQLDYYETASFSAALDEMDKSKTYYIYCRSGTRSSNAQAMMAEKGFTKVYNLDGGILAWRKAQLPVVTP